jgi:hypothetical protein
MVIILFRERSFLRGDGAKPARRHGTGTQRAAARPTRSFGTRMMQITSGSTRASRGADGVSPE